MKMTFNITYIIIFISVCSCNQQEIKPQAQLFSQDYLELKKDNKLEIIDLDSVHNYKNLISRMSKIACKDKLSGLKISFKDTIYNIIGYTNCPEDNTIGCYFRRNFITIQNDSLILERSNKGRKEPIGYLKTMIDSIISKPHNYISNEDKLKPALIQFNVEEKYPINTTKKVLREIATRFQAVVKTDNPDFFSYSILFVNYDISKIPPPPPPPSK